MLTKDFYPTLQARWPNIRFVEGNADTRVVFSWDNKFQIKLRADRACLLNELHDKLDGLLPDDVNTMPKGQMIVFVIPSDAVVRFGVQTETEAARNM